MTPCVFCNGSHRHSECTRVTTVQAKRDVLRKGSRCFKCLGQGHFSNKCPQRYRTCSQCKGAHHVVLCDRGSDRVDVKFTSTFDSSRVLLQTLGLQVEGKNGRAQVRVMLDPRSQISFIESNLAHSIGASQCGNDMLQIDPFGIQGTAKHYTGYSVFLERFDGQRILNVRLIEVPRICSNQRVMDDLKCISRLKELGHEVADRPMRGNDQIRLLIGSDYYWQLVTGRTERVDNGLTLIETMFGWVANGRSSPVPQTHSKVMVGLTGVHFDLERFWDVEHLGIKDDVGDKVLDDEVFKRFKETFERDESGRYIVRLPWKTRSVELRSNESGAMARLRKLLWRFERNSKLRDQYKGAIKEYIDAGHVKRVDNASEDNGFPFYLPHHVIVKEDRATIKVRIVFDASAHAASAPSLNDCLYAGPQLLPDLSSLLIQFRSYRVTFIGDIAKAFLQVALNKQDRDSVRLLWVDDEFWADHASGDRLSRHRVVLRKTVVLFGATSSPFLLNATIKCHIEGYRDQYPKVTFLLSSNLYVDDLIGGADSVGQAFDLSMRCKAILGDAKMVMRKWDSSSRELLLLWNEAKEEIADRELIFQDDVGKVKVLGVRWHRVSDCFTFGWENVDDASWTKRKMLSLMAQIYDPMRFVAPDVVIIKMLMQRIWKLGLSWDESMDGKIIELWSTWLQEQPLLSQVRVPRWIGSVGGAIGQQVSQHVFCDASSVAYGAVVFIRVEDNDNVQVSFLMAKSRVAPLKAITIPRLELLAVLLGSRLVTYCVRAFCNLHIDSVFGWTDSEITFHWLSRTPEHWKPFVSHRVREVQEKLSGCQWRHVAGVENPADLISRGCTLSKLLSISAWWKGLSWMRSGESSWPPVFLASSKIVTESRVEVGIIKVRDVDLLLDCCRYSSFERLLRVTAWVFRVFYRSGSIELSCDKIWRAELWWVQFVQRETFVKEFQDLCRGDSVNRKSPLYQFNPFIDKGVIRVGGQLSFADLDFGQAHPIILPSSGQIVSLIVRWYHAKSYHVGVTETLSVLRTRYWLLRGRRTVAWALRACLVCSRFRAKPFRHREAPLPSFRLTNTRAFAYTGVDFAGPLWVREDQGDQM